MAIYSTFFLVSDDAALDRALPGWRRPLIRPVPTQRVNPFTRATITCDSFDPKDAPGFVAAPSPQPPLTSQPPPPVGDAHAQYLAYLEARMPPGVRAQPHLAWKSITPLEIGLLVESWSEEPFDVASLRDVRFGAAGDSLTEVPRALCDALTAMSPGERRALATRWIEHEELADWEVDDCAALLANLALLIRSGGPLDRVLLLMEC